MILLLEPLTGVVLAAVVLGERLGAAGIAGAVLLGGAVLLAGRSGHSRVALLRSSRSKATPL